MTPARNFRKARDVNSSSANFPTWVTTEIDPSLAVDLLAADRRVLALGATSGNGLSSSGGMIPEFIDIYPYGLGANNDVFDFQLVGYRRIAPALSDQRVQWLRFLLGVWTATISNAVGLAGGTVLNTERFADTIAIKAATGEATITADVTRKGTQMLYSPANDSPAHVIAPLYGAELIEFEWDQTTNTPTMNALLSFLDC